jgi:hypothetical protein
MLVCAIREIFPMTGGEGFAQGVFKKSPNFCYKDFILHFKHCALHSSPLYWRYTVPNLFFHRWNASWNSLSVMARSYLIAFS